LVSAKKWLDENKMTGGEPIDLINQAKENLKKETIEKTKKNIDIISQSINDVIKFALSVATEKPEAVTKAAAAKAAEASELVKRQIETVKKESATSKEEEDKKLANETSKLIKEQPNRIEGNNNLEETKLSENVERFDALPQSGGKKSRKSKSKKGGKRRKTARARK